VREISKISDGVIVGSAIVRLVAEHGKESIEPVKRFVRELSASLR
jgi:tryptophan synthase alpha chain